MPNAVVVMTSLSQLLTLLMNIKCFVRDACVYILIIQIRERLDTGRAQWSHGSACSEVADKDDNLLDWSRLAPSSFANSRNVSTGLTYRINYFVIYGASQTYYAAMDTTASFFFSFVNKSPLSLIVSSSAFRPSDYSRVYLSFFLNDWNVMYPRDCQWDSQCLCT